MQIRQIINKGIRTSGLVEVKLPDTDSKNVQGNNAQTYCSRYEGLKGLFRKDVDETKKFGRRICDKVIQELNNRGFFTTDEVLNDGVSAKEVEQIFQQTKADREDDLVTIFAYEREEAQRTKNFLDELLLEENS